MRSQGRRFRNELHECTNSINKSHQKLVSPRLSSGKKSSSFLLQCCVAKNLLKPTKVKGDIFAGRGMQAAILASNSFNVSLLINIKRTMRFGCLPVGGNVEEKRIKPRKTICALILVFLHRYINNF